MMIFQKHNLIFLRYHYVSNDDKKRGRRKGESFNYDELKKGPRFSQMLQMNHIFKPHDVTKSEVKKTVKAIGKLAKMTDVMDYSYDPKVSTCVRNV